MNTLNFEFRPARIEDAAAIRDLVRAAYAAWVPVIGREPMPMRADYDKAVRDHRFELLYGGDGALLGLIETEDRDDHLWIENVAVRPDRQGKGLGAKLLRQAEAGAVARGLAEARLLTNEAFTANVALYERLGYVVTLREPFMNGITVYMSKRL